jgi:ATP-binding protein involved in chromosome partitioning
MMLTREDILRALAVVECGENGTSVVEAGMISGVTVKEGGRVGFLITITAADRDKKAWLQPACEQAVLKLPGVTKVTAVLTAQATDPNPVIRNGVDSRRSSIATTPAEAEGKRSGGESPPPITKKARWNTEPIPFVRRLIAVASGKGGVGKSTTAVNLAHALSASGRHVGLLDADIYGPSLPRMMGLSGMPDTKEGRIIPPSAYGIACMSMGLLVGEDSALVWRGPQMSKALAQLLRGVAWGNEAAPLDALIIDMPPGTGDVHLSLVQQAPVDGAVIVTTPQDVAVADARKCIDMFRKTRVPVLGVIENMSGFLDPATGMTHAIFGAGGGRRLAQTCSVPFLGAVPIEIALREASDAGEKYQDKARVYTAIAALIV